MSYFVQTGCAILPLGSLGVLNPAYLPPHLFWTLPTLHARKSDKRKADLDDEDGKGTVKKDADSDQESEQEEKSKEESGETSLVREVRYKLELLVCADQFGKMFPS